MWPCTLKVILSSATYLVRVRVRGRVRGRGRARVRVRVRVRVGHVLATQQLGEGEAEDTLGLGLQG